MLIPDRCTETQDDKITPDHANRPATLEVAPRVEKLGARAIHKLPRTPNLTELTYRSIKHTVLTGDVERSFRLTEEYLANHLGISKSPVREALNRLESEGLIHIEARRGAYVRQFSAKEVSDLYDLRMLFEIHCAAAAVITPAFLAKLAASIQRSETILASGDRRSHIEEDLYFHYTIAEATGNEELCRTFENVQQKTVLCRYKSYDLSAALTPLAHTRIYQALLNQNRPEACKAMQEHILDVRNRLLARMEPQSDAPPECPELHY